MPKPTEELLAELQKSVLQIEARLGHHEKGQDTVAKRMDDNCASLINRLAVLDDRMSKKVDGDQFITLQKEALGQKLSLGWNIVTYFMLLMTILFALLFTRELLDTDKVQKALTTMEQGSKSLAEGEKAIAANAAAFSEVLGLMANAGQYVNEANREYLRNDWAKIKDLSNQAIDTLITAYNLMLKSSGSNVRINGIEDVYQNSLFDPKSCRLIPVPGVNNRAAELQKASVRNGFDPTVLKRAIEDRLASAYEMLLRATFFGKKYDQRPLEIHAYAVIIAKLKPQEADGFHWIGLAQSDLGNYDLAEACYEIAVHQAPRPVIKDYINLAELAFVRGKYADAVKYAKTFMGQWKDDPFGAVNPVTAQFYMSLAEYMLAKDASGLASLERFRTEMAKSKIKLEGSFDSKVFDVFLARAEAGDIKELTDAKKREIKLTVDCFNYQKNCNLTKAEKVENNK